MPTFTVLDRSSEDSGDWDVWEIIRSEGDDSESIANCYDEAWAYKLLAAIQWMQSMEETGMMPAPPSPKPKRKKVKTKMLHEEESDS